MYQLTVYHKETSRTLRKFSNKEAAEAYFMYLVFQLAPVHFSITLHYFTFNNYIICLERI